jgi:hypothetical protein
MKNYIVLFLAFILMTAGLSGCKKLIDVSTPQNQLTTDKVYTDTTATTAVLISIYALFDKTIDPNYNKFMGLYTDELNYPTSTSNGFLLSNLATNDVNVLNIWKNNYFAIYSCNDMITQLRASNSLPSTIVASYTAEAKFLRAYSYFYLVNSFGSIPLVLTTDVTQTAKAVKSDSASVYRQIVSDLTDAQTALSVNYIGSGKVRANKFTATAMLARVNLYQRDWVNAEANASTVINSGLYSLTPSPAGVFFANSNEAIFQFYTQYGFITDAPTLIPSSGKPLYPITPVLLNAFEPGDLRKTNWLRSTVVSGTTFYYPYKYHNRTTNTSTPEYLMALRLAEQYLIRAEARAHQGNVSGAINDLNLIRTRAGLTPLSTSINQNAAYNAISQEWRIEFFTEWGHRYLELKRTDQLNTAISAYKSTWSSKSILLPIPQNEITYDSNLKQNNGY